MNEKLIGGRSCSRAGARSNLLAPDVEGKVLPVTRSIALTSLLSLFFAHGALAQEDTIEDGMYVRVGAGAAFVSDLEQDFVYNPASPPGGAAATGQTVAVSESMTFAAAIGFDYDDGIRTELEYRYANTDIDSVTPIGGPAAGVAAVSDEQLQSHLVMANFYFDFANSSPLTPFIGGGIGGAFVSNERDQSDAALAYQGRAGVSYDAGAGVSVSAEYIYARSRDLVFGPNDDAFAEGDPRPFRLEGANFVSSSVMLSVRKRF